MGFKHVVVALGSGGVVTESTVENMRVGGVVGLQTLAWGGKTSRSSTNRRLEGCATLHVA